MTRLAFHGDPAIKDLHVERARQRAQEMAPQFRFGFGYWTNGCGHVGVSVHGCEPAAYAEEIGVPLSLVLVEDDTFRNLPKESALNLGPLFLSAIRPGVDLSSVPRELVASRLDDPNGGMVRFLDGDIIDSTWRERLVAKIGQVAALFRENCQDEAKWHAAAFAVEDLHPAIAADWPDELRGTVAERVVSSVVGAAHDAAQEVERWIADGNPEQAPSRAASSIATAAMRAVTEPMQEGDDKVARTEHYLAVLGDEYGRQAQKLLELLSAA